MIDSRNAQLPGVQTAGRPMPVSRYWKPSYRLRGWLARTCGMPSSAICIGAQATWRAHNDIATARLPRRLLRPCATSSGAD